MQYVRNVLRVPLTERKMAWLGLGLYVVAGLALLPLYRHQINPDGVSYITIAGSYLHGHLLTAINAYWGPLFSWLLAPFLVVRGHPLVAAKLLNLLIGAALLVGAGRLLREFNPRAWARWPLLGVLTILVLSWALPGPITPDLLIATILTYYCYYLFQYRKAPSVQLSVICGLLGGLAFLAKSYGLPFFVMHFTLFMTWDWVSSRPSRKTLRATARHWAYGMAAFMLVAVPWITAISLKQHRLTTGTSAAYNLSLVAPGNTGHPMFTDGLMAPPNPDATSVWDDPSGIRLQSWNVHLFSHPHNFRPVVALVGFNLQALVTLLNATSVWALAVLALVVLIGLPIGRKSYDYPSLFIVATSLIYIAGYALTFFEDRYIWIVTIMLLCACARLIWLWERTPFSSPVRNGILVAALALAFLPAPIAFLRSQVHFARNIAWLSADVAKVVDLRHQRTASDTDWGDSLYVTFYTGGAYYGLLQPTVHPARQLKEDDIRYVFHWGVFAERPDYLAGFEPVYYNQANEFTIFRRVGH